MVTTGGALLTLRDGDLQAGIAPNAGGSLAFLRFGQEDVFRPMRHGGLSVEAHASFPMLPICNRLLDNRLPVGSAWLPVLPNVAGEAWHLHGTGWQERWHVVAQDDQRAEIVTSHASDGDPWCYTARQLFTLDGGTLSIETAIRNDAGNEMPFAIGHHPWFLRDADTVLAFAASAMWPDARERPVGALAGGPAPLPPDCDFGAGRRLPARGLDNCFEGWDGRCRIEWPSRGLALDLHADPTMAYLAVYADPARPDFCVEPQTMATHAMSLSSGRGAARGVVTLAPGDTLRAAIGFTPRRLRD